MWCLIRSRVFLNRPHRLNFFSSSEVCKEYTSSEFKDAYLPGVVENEEFNCYNYFTPSIKAGEVFTVILPPPNITGTLHLGHALTTTIQDVLVRWKRMDGVESIWIPGIDHAGIATQVVVEKQLWKENRQTRHDIGREAFQRSVWKWKDEKASVIEQQLKRLGASLEWSRKVFTMDPIQSEEVSKAFVKLFESDLIYRADSLVNWSCTLQSAISDIEVDRLELDGPTQISVPNYNRPIEFGTMTSFAYKLENSEEEIVVATTRPETMIGDVAVAVNPSDDRYARYVGRNLWHPFRKETIPVIADDFVHPDFGTGAVKVTPAHDPVDFEVAKRHSLPILQVIDEKGNVTSDFQDFSGMPRFDVRDAVIARLETLRLLRGIQGHKMVVPVCSRSKDIIEHLVRPQWFIKCSEMAKEAVEDVRQGRLRLEPKHFERVWFDWLENIRDWCISRQLWWGHQIPVYNCRLRKVPTTSVWIAAETSNEALHKASRLFSANVAAIEIQQDNDVLDTWFSSALLPFSAWSKQEHDITNYYPLDIMITGHDILFFWIARMVMLGKKLTGKLPFEKVLLHGIICDSEGRKMSKSLGNVVTPENVIEGATTQKLEAAVKNAHLNGILSSDEFRKSVKDQKKKFPFGIPECGADALRFTLCSHNIKNHFINFDVQECHTNKLFCNKIWQATKYVNGVIKKTPSEWLIPVDFDKLGLMDQWILSKLTHMVETCNNGLENNDFYLVTAAIKDFIYFHFCDVYLETTKRAFKMLDRGNAAGHCWVLTVCLDIALRAIAPFMPRISQHLHQRLILYPQTEKSVTYPKTMIWRNISLEDEVSKILDVVTGTRRLKKFFGVVAKYKPELFIIDKNLFFERFKSTIEDLAALHKLHLVFELSSNLLKDTVSDRVAGDTFIYLVLPPDLPKLLELDVTKLETQKSKLIKELDKLNRMVSGANYRIKATEEAQRLHTKKIANLEEKLKRINYIQNLSRQ